MAQSTFFWQFHLFSVCRAAVQSEGNTSGGRTKRDAAGLCLNGCISLSSTCVRQTRCSYEQVFFIAYLLQSPPSLERALVTAMVMGEVDASDTSTFLWLKGMADLLSRWGNFYPWGGHWDFSMGWMVLGECPLAIWLFLESLDSSVPVCKLCQIKSCSAPLSLESVSEFYS